MLNLKAVEGDSTLRQLSDDEKIRMQAEAIDKARSILEQTGRETHGTISG